MPIEWDIRAADTHLASAIDGVQTTCELAHPRGPAGEGYPASPVFWATIAPDDPNEREDVIVTALALSAAVATIRRGVGYSLGLPHRAGTPVRLGTRAGAYPEEWHVIGGAGEPAFANGWGNLGGAFATAAFKRHPDGLVLLRGRISGGTAAAAAFTLPVGYRPGGSTVTFFAEQRAGARIDVGGTSGNVVPQDAGGSSTLDDVRFHAEA